MATKRRLYDGRYYEPKPIDADVGDTVQFVHSITGERSGKWKITSVEPPRGIYVDGDNRVGIGREFGMPYPLDYGCWEVIDDPFEHFVRKARREALHKGKK